MFKGTAASAGEQRQAVATATREQTLTPAGAPANSDSLRTVGLGYQSVCISQTAGTLGVTVAVQFNISNSWFTLETFSIPTLSTTVFRSYRKPSRAMRVRVLTDPGADAVLDVKLGAAGAT